MAKTKVVRGKCTVPGCDRPHKARGYCAAHQQRWMRGVDVNVPLRSRVAKSLPECSEPDCGQPVKAKGLCQMHYARLLRYGVTKYPDRKTIPKRCAHPGCDSQAYAKGYCGQHYQRERVLQEKYGLPFEVYQELLKAQDGVCAICKGVQERRNGKSGKLTDFHVDHNHETGDVRGMLCNGCNVGLGMFKDDPALLRAAAAYLDLHAGLPAPS